MVKYFLISLLLISSATAGNVYKITDIRNDDNHGTDRIFYEHYYNNILVDSFSEDISQFNNLSVGQTFFECPRDYIRNRTENITITYLSRGANELIFEGEQFYVRFDTDYHDLSVNYINGKIDGITIEKINNSVTFIGFEEEEKTIWFKVLNTEDQFIVYLGKDILIIE